ncbi:hypothetical protein CORC01_04453 [Colletotrichum orchidophilum]|uniref:Uncharacterized protein n=1 Tax=Colletotrichum orchidophilum TaxID=1209926 RepID=A0A1G4BFU7_9PEZI|nr:uncharacterized protein CORC01_04453 [Colletotrichum orchidophilum]OHF00264.1 hypothetical protein CORC01_04453 [Colletotrichum orchidophilum]
MRKTCLAALGGRGSDSSRSWMYSLSSSSGPQHNLIPLAGSVPCALLECSRGSKKGGRLVDSRKLAGLADTPLDVTVASIPRNGPPRGSSSLECAGNGPAKLTKPAATRRATQRHSWTWWQSTVMESDLVEFHAVHHEA